MNKLPYGVIQPIASCYDGLWYDHVQHMVTCNIRCIAPYGATARYMSLGVVWLMSRYICAASFVVSCLATQNIALTPREQNIRSFFWSVCSLGHVVRFRAAFAEHIPLRPYGQQLLKFFCSWDRTSLEHTLSSYSGLWLVRLLLSRSAGRENMRALILRTEMATPTPTTEPPVWKMSRAP